MNDEPLTPTSPNGQDPVEARIVAWVLGETSAEESAEIERLCEQRPELRSFCRRMRSLHGLLTEAEAATPDDSWKLPAEKRKRLDDIFLGPSIPFVRKKAVAKRSLLTIAASIVLLLAVTGIITSTLVRKNTESNVKMAALPQTSPQVDFYALKSAVRDQEDRVEERRKILIAINRYDDIVFREKTGPEADRRARELLSSYNALESERMQIESQLKGFLSHNGDQLRIYASGLDVPDNLVKKLYPEFLEKKKEHEEQNTNASVKDSASVLAKTKELMVMDQQINQEIIATRSKLQEKHDRVIKQLDHLQALDNDNLILKATHPDLDTNDRVGAKKEYENSMARLKELRAMLEQTKGARPPTAKP
jgi:hypothetical protein